jgi:acetyl-CoA C-acetyltransferase
MSDNVVIVTAVRTAVGNFGGSLATLPAHTLGAAVIADVIKRSGIKPEQVDEVIFGQVLTAGTGQNPARQAAIIAGLPNSVPCMTINKVCGSGLKTVHLAAQAIKCGDAEIIIAGGQESMSLSPHVLPNSRNGTKMGDWKMLDSMIVDGLWDAQKNMIFLGKNRMNLLPRLNRKLKLHKRRGNLMIKLHLLKFLNAKAIP